MAIDGSTEKISVADDGSDFSDLRNEGPIDPGTAPVANIVPTPPEPEDDTSGDRSITVDLPLDSLTER